MPGMACNNPPPETNHKAWSGAVGAVMGWLATYFGPRNAPKVCVVLLAGLLLVGCASDRSGALGDRDGRCAVYETAYLALAVGRDSHNADQAARLRAYEVSLMRFCGGVPAVVPLQPSGN